jgi:hypothetical protein
MEFPEVGTRPRRFHALTRPRRGLDNTETPFSRSTDMAEVLRFTKWLMQYRGEETALGDLARQVAQDPEWQDPGSLAALESALQGAGCSMATLQTARRAWRRYLADSARPPAR